MSGRHLYRSSCRHLPASAIPATKGSADAQSTTAAHVDFDDSFQSCDATRGRAVI